jgi:hypothetical protein
MGGHVALRERRGADRVEVGKFEGKRSLRTPRNKKHSHYRPELAWRVDGGIALPFRDLGARRG